jgi:very-short-patch-repair endonuclease
MNKDKIIKLYVDKELSTYEIAKEMNTYPNKIRRILVGSGVDLRDRSSAQKTALKHGRSKHPTKGIKKTDAQKLVLSEAMEKRWQNMSEKDRNEFSKNAKKRWEEMSEVDKTALRKKAAEGLRRSSIEGSKAEKFLYQKLMEVGYNVVLHKKGLIEGQNFEIDLFIPEIKLIIEIDGPQHFMPMFGEEHLRNYVKFDSVKNGLLLGKGYCVIRVKYLCKHISGAIKRKLWDIVSPEIKRVEKKFPPKGKRLIELEIS